MASRQRRSYSAEQVRHILFDDSDEETVLSDIEIEPDSDDSFVPGSNASTASDSDSGAVEEANARRWWKYLFWGILNIGLINAYILWMTANRPLPANTRLFGLKAFKLKLVHNLCDGFTQRAQRPAPAVDELVVERVVSNTIIEGHPLVKFVGRKRACRICARQHRRAARGGYVVSTFGCSACNVYLCRTGECFTAYHV